MRRFRYNLFLLLAAICYLIPIPCASQDLPSA